jgi:membrane-associated phospholipid phosphatase
MIAMPAALFLALSAIISSQSLGGATDDGDSPQIILEKQEDDMSEGEASAEHRLSWHPKWRRSDYWDYSLFCAGMGTTVYLQNFRSPPETPLWTSRLPLDEETRSALHGRSAKARHSADLVSDVLWYTPQLWPLVDATLVPTLGDNNNTDVAWELTFMYLETMFTALSLASIGQRFAGRARPDYQYCESPDKEGCQANHASFPSGHTAGAMAGAALVCQSHGHLPLYGPAWLDSAACGTAVTLAAGAGVTRIVADRHYLSDVIVGGALGFGVGYSLPILLHFGTGSYSEGDETLVTWRLRPDVSTSKAGLLLSGTF